MSVDRDSASYRFIDDGKPPQAASVEVVTGVVTEYGQIRSSGDVLVWNTAPHVEKVYPLSKRMDDAHLDNSKAYRRRVIVVEDWAEVDEP